MKRTWVVLLCAAHALALPGKKPQKTPEQLRAEYLERLQQYRSPAPPPRTVGSLWSEDNALLGDLTADYKARRLHDTITVTVAVQTTAAQSGSVNTARQFGTSSAITGIFGHAPSATNPLLAANSNTTLKGSGQTASNTTFQTSLTGQVIAVMPNGNLVIEAQREIFMNNQHENVVVRGMVRPGDISPGNVVPSTSLSNLEIEMKGKGIISDGTRPPNPITRAILWLFGL